AGTKILLLLGCFLIALYRERAATLPCQLGSQVRRRSLYKRGHQGKIVRERFDNIRRFETIPPKSYRHRCFGKPSGLQPISCSAPVSVLLADETRWSATVARIVAGEL